MAKRLEDFLDPRGNGKVPNVLDADGNIVSSDSDNIITDNFTAVDLGDTPNSNNGDPLRLAFAKINNFIEASYHHAKSVDDALLFINSDEANYYLSASLTITSQIQPVIVDNTPTAVDPSNPEIRKNDFWYDLANKKTYFAQDDGTFVEV